MTRGHAELLRATARASCHGELASSAIRQDFPYRFPCHVAVDVPAGRCAGDRARDVLPETKLSSFEAGEDLRPGLLHNHWPELPLVAWLHEEGDTVVSGDHVIYLHQHHLAIEHPPCREDVMVPLLPIHEHVVDNLWVRVRNRSNRSKKVARPQLSLANIVVLHMLWAKNHERCAMPMRDFFEGGPVVEFRARLVNALCCVHAVVVVRSDRVPACFEHRVGTMLHVLAPQHVEALDARGAILRSRR
mmetsp:Transcript_88098/g.233066  ORF Transcript_88098/g.233066 Transcript_88098/m.233066 type:complete len:246 (-) Transcript_88098:189-926(-)